MEIFVTGATGAVGRPLVAALAAAGHQVIAASRHPDGSGPAAEHVEFDIDEPLGAAATAAMQRAEAGYYLLHALGDPDFASIDRGRAADFASRWGAGRPLVYLGGLGLPGTGSAHLRSRHEVGAILQKSTHAVELRASMVLGGASLSFQLLARLGRLASYSPLPILVPTAATASTQPIAEADLIASLVHALDVSPGSYDIGGPDVMRYADLIARSAAIQGRCLRVWPLLPVPPDLIGPAAALGAGVDPWATAALFAGMGEETVVRPGHELPGDPLGITSVDDAIRAALVGS